MTAHTSLLERGRGIHYGQWHQACTCGWEAPGWHGSQHGIRLAWAEHVKEANAEEAT